MGRSATIFVCAECGTVERKWHGQCPGCGAWNTLAEEHAPPPAAGRSAGAGARRARAVEPVVLSEVRAARIRRIATGVGELDRVLGVSRGGGAASRGLVPGSLVLLGGAPGIGKSTLVGAALGNLVAGGARTLYVSGEESAEQIRMRHQRLGAEALAVPVVTETDLDTVIATIEAQRPAVCVIDSVQTLCSAGLSGAAGSVGQVREVAARLMRVAKTQGAAIVLVGHVTKDGSLAGPRVLEHLVDCVLHFEGERERSYRTLRAVKNRFGSTDEVGVFEMAEQGLVEIADASARFAGEATGDPGSVVYCAIEGSRPLLVEVQALVVRSEIVPPRRVVSGVDRNRLALVLAVLARHAGLALGDRDVFVNAVGGVRIDEPAADLAIALAVASAARGVPLGRAGRAVACFGELGLTGELRCVSQPDRRAAEAVKFGLDDLIVPAAATVGGVSGLRQALTAAFKLANSAENASHAVQKT